MDEHTQRPREANEKRLSTMNSKSNGKPKKKSRFRRMIPWSSKQNSEFLETSGLSSFANDSHTELAVEANSPSTVAISQLEPLNPNSFTLNTPYNSNNSIGIPSTREQTTNPVAISNGKPEESLSRSSERYFPTGHASAPTNVTPKYGNKSFDVNSEFSRSHAPAPTNVTPKHGNKTFDSNPLGGSAAQRVALPAVQKAESPPPGVADKSTKPSTTPPAVSSATVGTKKDIAPSTLAEESAKQRKGTLSNEPTKQPPSTGGATNESPINRTNTKIEYLSQPSNPTPVKDPRSKPLPQTLADEGDLKTQVPNPANITQEDPKVATKPGTSQNHNDEDENLKAYDQPPVTIPQEDSKLSSSFNIFSRLNPFGRSNKPKAKGEREAKLTSDTLPVEAKHVKTEELREEDVVIAVMGPTGSGKSTFINVITGVDTGVGHDLESCTSEIGLIKMTFPDYNIVFVDTPGFDDTKRSDSDILKMISDWLEITFQRKILLSGLLYFHRISDNRMAGTPLKNLRMFEELCGKNAFKNVILTTTMWDEVDEETGVTREEELKGIYWKAMIDRHSSTGRFVGTRDSAFRLIAPLLDGANNRNKLLLQKELVDLDLRLSETHAGQKLRSEIKQLAKQQQELLHQIREELKRPNNATSLQSLMEEYEELKKTSGSLLTQIADLQVPLGRQLMNTITITFGIKRNRAKDDTTADAEGATPAEAKGATLVEAKDAAMAGPAALVQLPDEGINADIVSGIVDNDKSEHLQTTTCWIAAEQALKHARSNMSSVSEIFDKSQIQKSEYAVYAGFDESLIKSGVGYIEQIHVFVSAEVDANSPLLVELGRLFSPFSSILFTGSSWYRMPVFKTGLDGDIWNFHELTYFTASKFSHGGSSAKAPLTVISLPQTPRLADGPTGFSQGGSGTGDGEKNEDRRSKKGKERDRGDNNDKGDKNDKDPDDDPEDPFEHRGGTIVPGPPKIFFEIVSKVYPIHDNLNAFQTLTMEGSLTIKTAPPAPQSPDPFSTRHVQLTGLTFGTEPTMGVAYQQFYVRVTIKSQHKNARVKWKSPKRTPESEREEKQTTLTKKGVTRGMEGGLTLGPRPQGTIKVAKTKTNEETAGSEKKRYTSRITEQHHDGKIQWGFYIDDLHEQETGIEFPDDALPTVCFEFVGDPTDPLPLPKCMNLEIASYWSIIPASEEESNWIRTFLNLSMFSGNAHATSYSNLGQIVALETVPSDLPPRSDYKATMHVRPGVPHTDYFSCYTKIDIPTADSVTVTEEFTADDWRKLNILGLKLSEHWIKPLENSGGDSKSH